MEHLPFNTGQIQVRFKTSIFSETTVFQFSDLWENKCLVGFGLSYVTLCCTINQLLSSESFLYHILAAQICCILFFLLWSPVMMRIWMKIRFFKH